MSIISDKVRIKDKFYAFSFDKLKYVEIGLLIRLKKS